MWDVLTQMIVGLAVTALKIAIKNPASVAKESSIISTIAQAATEADVAVNGTVWTNTPAPPAAK